MDEIIVQQRAFRPIFVLGDSRTGTMSLHNYFLVNGLRSIHYFNRESGLSLPTHLNMEVNTKRFLAFVRESGFEAFSDYPTRVFYQALFDNYPNAAFILTSRKSTERWAKSMESYFSKFNQKVDIAALSRPYEGVNEKIRKLFGDGKRHFLDICIDGNSDENSTLLADFLGLTRDFTLGRDNSSDSTNVDILSQRYKLYSNQRERTLDATERMIAPSKALVSEYGWLFPIADTSDFLRVQFGPRGWSAEERARAANVIRARANILKNRKATYRKFIIPEKSVVYCDYLPRVYADLKQLAGRPAHMLQADAPEFVSYLDAYLTDVRSYGLIYFRGGTHTTWLGSWFVYRHIIQKLARETALDAKEMFTLAQLLPTLVVYDGDLVGQINPKMAKEFKGRWGFTSAGHGFELAQKFEIPKGRRLARLAEVPHVYRSWFDGRETLVYERLDGVGLRAVIFRDSTLDLCHDLLAQHFSRSVFIWHQGEVYEEVIEREQPDIVLHVMAERFVIQYPTAQVLARITRGGAL